jgi:carbon dioxide concentrating mechanism protein CcmM
VDLAKDTLQQMQTLLQQGYRIGMEHVDKRRFQTNSWKSCTMIDSQNPADVKAALEGCLVQYPDEYVRMIGIDPQTRKRVLEQIIQRP